MPKRNLLFNIFLCVSTAAFSQDTVSVRLSNDFGLVDYKKNIIINPTSLHPFFEKLFKLKKEKKETVSILHIGDSHIQADFLTNQIRQKIQQEFGNAGRGLVVPLKVVQSNEPINYLSQSESQWESKRMVFPDQPLPIGIGGVTIRSLDENSSLKITLKNSLDLNYAFNKVTTFFLQEQRSFNIALKDSLEQDLAFMGNFSTSVINHSTTVALPNQTNSIVFQAFKSLAKQDRLTLFGFSFANGNPGVLYHAIGVNGAKYKHYLAAEYFAEQTKALNPDLIILALGTNEALDHPYSDKNFISYVDGVIQKLKTQNPNALLIISIHADSFKKKSKKNPGIIDIREKLMDYCKEKSIACFDLYAAGGGKNSASDWRKAALLRDDGVHFTKAGYELQGNMLYLALMKAYNQYVSHRPR
jgi:lysophospholipase L1-like esterase